MDSPANSGSITPNFPIKLIKHNRYLNESQISELVRSHNPPLDSNQAIVLKHQVYGLIWGVAEVLRFPVRTVGTAMQLYQRFALLNGFLYSLRVDDIAATCLFVACKIMDTPKPMRNILVTLRNIRTTQLVDIDAPVRYICINEEVSSTCYFFFYLFLKQTLTPEKVIEEQKRRVVGLERSVLETISFDFVIRQPQIFLIKIAKALGGKFKLHFQNAYSICF